MQSVARGRLSGTRPERIGWLLVAGTIPVAILGVFFEKPVRSLFASTAIVGVFLILNAFIMFAGEWLKAQSRRGVALADLPLGGGVAVGTAQALALFPGISRSGASMVAGLIAGLDHEDAARYSFLLAIPAIGAAALFEVPKLFAPEAHMVLIQAAVGALVAGVTAYLSVAFLTRYFKSNDLRPFGWYCLIAGALAVGLAVTKRILMKPLAFGMAAICFVLALLYFFGVQRSATISSTGSFLPSWASCRWSGRASRKHRRRGAVERRSQTLARAARRVARDGRCRREAGDGTAREGSLRRAYVGTHRRTAADGLGPQGRRVRGRAVAGIMAAKQTAALIPLTHPIALSSVDVSFAWQAASCLEIEARAKTVG